MHPASRLRGASIRGDVIGAVKREHRPMKLGLSELRHAVVGLIAVLICGEDVRAGSFSPAIAGQARLRGHRATPEFQRQRRPPRAHSRCRVPLASEARSSG